MSADVSAVPDGAPARRSRWVWIPEGSVVVTLTPIEWAIVDHAVDQQVGAMSRAADVRSVERAAQKLRDARDQLRPTPHDPDGRA